MRNKEARRAALVRTKLQLDLSTAQRPRRNQCRDSRSPAGIVYFHRIPQVEHPRLWYDNPLFRWLPARLERWRIPIEQSLQAIDDFFQGFVFTFERTQRHLGQVARSEEWRGDEQQRVLDELCGGELPLGEVIQQERPGFRRRCQ